MARKVLSGSRIRDYRTAKGLRQIELAQRCDISPSYLNLIEHNRRRIGGALLLKIAEALDADPSVLSEGAEAALTTALDAAAEVHPDAGAERDRIEELASRFPGWARLIEAQYTDTRRLEQVVERLDDRMTHDPFLSASMHSVLTSVTAIRSASAILASGDTIEPEWQARFHRNIYEDSQRLAEATETLVGFLESDDSDTQSGNLPQEEFERWLAGRDWRITELEDDPTRTAAEVLMVEDAPKSAAARDLAERHIAQYARDVKALPFASLDASLTPEEIAAAKGIDLSVVFRRLATLPSEALTDGLAYGLVGCDGSGTLTFRKPVAGLDLPRYSGACPLWPLFRALQHPMMPVRECIAIGGRDELSFDVTAIAEVQYPMGYDRPPVLSAWMLIRERRRDRPSGAALRVGTSCRVCAESDCPARREASVFSAFEAEVL